MLSNLFTFVKVNGSSLLLPAHGRVGARATSFLAAHFAKQNTSSVGVQSEGEAEENPVEDGPRLNLANLIKTQSRTVLD